MHPTILTDIMCAALRYVLLASKKLSITAEFKKSQTDISPDDTTTDAALYDFIEQPPPEQPIQAKVANDSEDDDLALLEPKTEGSNDESSGADERRTVKEESMTPEPLSTRIYAPRALPDSFDDDDVQMGGTSTEEAASSETNRSNTLSGDTDMWRDPQSVSNARPGMGAGEGALEYDDEILFAPLVFYLDLSTNVESNRLQLSLEPFYERDEADEKSVCRHSVVSNEHC